MEKAMSNRSALMGIFALLLIASLSCNFPGSSQQPDETAIFMSAQLTLIAEQQKAEADQVQQAQPAQVQESTSDDSAAVQPSSTFTPEPTATATITPTATLDVPIISVTVDTNCRNGPGDVYDLTGFLKVGEKAEVIGWEGKGNFYVIKDLRGGPDCWLWANFAKVEGDTSNLKVYAIPPTPTPPILWAGSWTMKVEGAIYTITVAQTGLNVSGGFTIAGTNDTVSFSGTATANQMKVNGNYSVSNGTTGTFTWVMLSNKNQFQGEGLSNINVAGEWCGGRNGQNPPSPCVP
jgi:hypothetical protein